MAEWTDTSALDALAHEIEINFPMVYGPVIEYGCPPHPVSAEGVKSIRRWAELKPRISYTTKSGNSRRRKLKEDEVDALVNATVWKIRTKGQQPHPWLRPAVDDAKPRAYELLARGIKNNMGARPIADYIVTRAQEYLDMKKIHNTGTLGKTFRITDLDTGEILEDHT